MLEEVDANIRKHEPVWRETGDGHGVALVATDAGLAAIGVEPEAATAEPAPQKPCKKRAPRVGTKQARLIAMLRAPEGATIAEITTALTSAPHTCRVAMSGALKKKLGLEITSEKDDQRGRVYRLAAKIL